MSFAQRHDAERFSARAIELAPEDPYVITVRGYTSLIDTDSHYSVSLFEKALARGSNLSLTHLGLGLAQIKDGDLEGGRLSVQKAVHLEPGTSLYRSYLGKVFFEQENEKLSDAEYAEAIKLDPRDPTPFLYRSFLKLSQRRPVEALNDIEESIARNDNRAVYRSRLLLDQDTAVRSSSLAQVFNTVGFNQVSRAEALRSLNHDNTNYSAHLLLADAYSQTDALIGTSVSQYLISRLLAPVNFNLVKSSNAGQASFSGKVHSLIDQ